ncbi:hypothetical protein HAX54_022503 [Datura stramonium]|uniref:Uncharacterized protein n=1 Tax=Datura stramonium TaxID=4076 RepID=A0ABS8S4L4_DATST|nr:hypothetical protein [Datura stramonium]
MVRVRLFPTGGDIVLGEDTTVLVANLMSGFPLNMGVIIADEMRAHATKFSTSLPFLCLVIGLCKEAHVPILARIDVETTKNKKHDLGKFKDETRHDLRLHKSGKLVAEEPKTIMADEIEEHVPDSWVVVDDSKEKEKLVDFEKSSTINEERKKDEKSLVEAQETTTKKEKEKEDMEKRSRESNNDEIIIEREHKRENKDMQEALRCSRVDTQMVGDMGASSSIELETTKHAGDHDLPSESQTLIMLVTGITDDTL